MTKKLIDMTEQELRLEIDGLAMGCHQVESGENYCCRGETPEAICDNNIELLNMKRRLVAAVYFAKQKGLKGALEPVDHFGGECAEVMAKWYLEHVVFVDTSLRRYNDFMKRGKQREAFEIVDRLKGMELICYRPLS